MNRRKIFDDRGNMLALNEFAKNFFVRNLTETNEGMALGYNYLKERGFNENTIKTFELGFGLTDRKALTNFALKSASPLRSCRMTRMRFSDSMYSSSLLMFFPIIDSPFWVFVCNDDECVLPPVKILVKNIPKIHIKILFNFQRTKKLKFNL